MKIALSVADMSVGGIANFVLNLTPRLVQAGHAVTVIAQRPGDWWPRLAQIGVDGYCLPGQRWDSVQKAAQRFVTYVTAQHFDVLLVNIGIDNRLPMLALPLLPDSMPVILALHNDRPEVYDLAAVNQDAWNCAVAVSPKVQQAAQARFAQKAIHRIGHGIALPTPEQFHDRADWSTPLRLLFVGRLDDAQKGIFRLPLILRACRDREMPVYLTVIGDGPDREHLAQFCAATGVADLVEMVGFQPSETVLAQMHMHQSLLLPSNYEGLPIVLLEAQAHGCVPIAARLPGITDDVMQDGVSGFLVNPPDIEGYVNGIAQLLSPNRWHTLSRNGIELSKQSFSLDSMGERYLALFNEVVGRVYPRSPERIKLYPPSFLHFSWHDYLPTYLVVRSRRLSSNILSVLWHRQGTV